MAMTSLDELPTELIWMIFSKVDFMSAISMQAVSKRWRDIIQNDPVVMKNIALATSRFLSPDWYTKCKTYCQVQKRLESIKFPVNLSHCKRIVAPKSHVNDKIMMDMPLDHHVDVYGFDEKHKMVICKRVEGDWFNYDVNTRGLTKINEPKILDGCGRFVIGGFPSSDGIVYVLVTKAGVKLVGNSIDYEIPTLELCNCQLSDIYKSVFILSGGIFIVFTGYTFHIFDVKLKTKISSKRFERGHNPNIGEFASFAATPTHLYHICQYSGLYVLPLEELVYGSKASVDIEDWKHALYLERDLVDQWYFGKSCFRDDTIGLCNSSTVLEVDLGRNSYKLSRLQPTPLNNCESFTVISCCHLESQMSQLASDENANIGQSPLSLLHSDRQHQHPEPHVGDQVQV